MADFLNMASAIRQPDYARTMHNSTQAGLRDGKTIRLRDLAREHGEGLTNMDPAALAAYAAEDPGMVANMKFRSGQEDRLQGQFDWNRQQAEAAAKTKTDAATEAKTGKFIQGAISVLDRSDDKQAAWKQIMGMAQSNGMDIQGLPEEYTPGVVDFYRGMYGIDSPEAPTPYTEAGKLEYDYRRGLIPQETYDKMAAALGTGDKTEFDKIIETMSPEDQKLARRIKVGLEKKAGENEGQVTLVDGTVLPMSPVKITESQAKGIIYADRMITSSQELDGLEDDGYNPANLQDRAVNNIPFSPTWMNTDVGKTYRNAAERFLIAVLRKDTGAAVTNTEWEKYSPLFFPVTGDGPDQIAQKRRARAEAISSLKGSLGVTRDAGPAPGDVVDGHRFKSGDASDPANWEAVE